MTRPAVSRRMAIGLAAIATLAAGCMSGDEEASPKRAGERPNVVMVMTDDQDLASMQSMPQTRRLLGRRGTTFANAFASLPLCCPSRATLLTGQYAHNHGVWGNKPPDGGYPAFSGRDRTLGVWLQEAGYRTAWIGKYLNGYGLDGDPSVPPGWTRWFSPLGFDSLLMYDYAVSDDGTVRRYGNRSRDYQTDVFADEALRFLRDDHGEAPFFLMLAPLAPHDEADTVNTGPRDPRPAPRHLNALGPPRVPTTPATNEASVEDKPRGLRERPLSSSALQGLAALVRDRRESLLAVDDAVARITRTLKREGELSETVVIFTSDNGYLLGQHRLVGGKSLPYRGIAGIPLIVRGPGFEAGARSAATVGNVDLAATITELAGLEADRELDGVSLLDADVASGRALLLESEDYEAVRTRRFLYVEHARGAVELYDLKRDPHELRNVANSEAYRPWIERLGQTLAELRDCAGAACRVAQRAATD